VWAIAIYLLIFTVSLAAVGLLVIFLPPRYFVDERSRFWADKPPLVRWLGIIGKNLLGLMIVALGVLLSLPGMPGQGILTILIGVMLLDIPGKRRVLRLLVRRKGVRSTIDRWRSWFGQPPMEFDA
jgi:hypothetical protein